MRRCGDAPWLAPANSFTRRAMRKKGGGEKGGSERKQEGACAGRTDRDRSAERPQGPADAWGHRRASRQSSRPMISRSRSRALRMRALTADSVEQVIAATSSVECPNTKASDMASC